MWTGMLVARRLGVVCLAGALLCLYAADRKKSQAAIQRAESARTDADALAAYDEAVAADPTNPAALSGRAKVRFRLGNRDQALADLDEAVKLQPADPQVRAVRGDFFRETGQPQRAVQEYEAAVAFKLERTEV